MAPVGEGVDRDAPLGDAPVGDAAIRDGAIRDGADPFVQIEQSLALLIRRAEAARTVDPRASIVDRSAYLLMSRLDTAGPMSIGALAQVFVLDISTVSRQVAALEAKGFVRRESDPRDARVSLLHLTPSGRERLEAARAGRYAMYRDLLRDWPQEDVAHFAALLLKFNDTVARVYGTSTKSTEN
ncbi:MAG: MarR family transcriptional regulator [Alicyclobacillus sp.]|nr:MarR family transcriptional regulator [Alicyclobacillus sp.]